MGLFRDTPYRLRTDDEKVRTQWGKALGLLNRGEWSAAVVRAVTAIEVAANLVVRDEHSKRGQLSPPEIDAALKAAGGLKGKMKLYRKLLTDAEKARASAIEAKVKSACDKRHSIVHSGEFCDEADARTHAASCKRFAEEIIAAHMPGFALDGYEIAPGADPGS